MEISQADSEVEDLLMHTYANDDDGNDSLLEQGHQDQPKGRKRKGGAMRSAK